MEMGELQQVATTRAAGQFARLTAEDWHGHFTAHD